MISGRGDPSDAVTLGEWFESHNLQDEVGGAAYVASLANNTPGASNILAYARIVREKSIMRQLIDVSSSIAGAAYSPEGRN